MKTDEGGYPFCLENKNGGWWAEGTAYTALMYRLRGNEDKYKEAMKALEGIQPIDRHGTLRRFSVGILEGSSYSSCGVARDGSERL